MWPYWFLFSVQAWFALTRFQSIDIGLGKRPWSLEWISVFVLLVLMIGLRYQVGGDWGSYIRIMNEACGYPLWKDPIARDPAYYLLSWFTCQSKLGVWFINTVGAVIFTWGLTAFCRAQPRPWLALVVAAPYLVTVVAMGYTRQGIAIGLVMLALNALSSRKLLIFVLFIATAATFHKTAIVLMPLAVLAGTRRWFWTATWVGVTFVVFYGLLLRDSVDTLTQNYIVAKYDSSGAAIRVAMNAVPATIFLIFRKRFAMPSADRKFWTWMSFGALAFVGLLVVSPSSTAVDRMALYWIPIQMFVLSRLPDAFGKQGGKNVVLSNAVVFYSASALFVWLFYAQTAYRWLPYLFYPLAAT